MKFLGYDNVMCLSAHPDDAEYGMLGTILKYEDTTFHMVCLSQGGNFDKTSTVGRVYELHNLWEGIPNIKGWERAIDYRTVEEQTEASIVNKIESLCVPFDEIKFDCIMLTPNEDSHFEHRKIHDVGIALARKKAISLIEYKTPSTLNTWTPNVYVDVSDELGSKIRLLQLFKSQLPNFYFDRMSLMSFHIDYQCQKRGLTSVESFKILGMYQ